jgi:hypothetical protein
MMSHPVAGAMGPEWALAWALAWAPAWAPGRHGEMVGFGRGGLDLAAAP